MRFRKDGTDPMARLKAARDIFAALPGSDMTANFNETFLTVKPKASLPSVSCCVAELTFS